MLPIGRGHRLPRIITGASLVTLLVGCSGQLGGPGRDLAAGANSTAPGLPAMGDPNLPGAPADSDAPAAAAGSVDPGVVPLRRLNRVEYDNTVQDLLGSELDVVDDFPADTLLYGFDTIAAALTVSPLHVEMYEQAAQRLVAELFARPSDDPRRAAVLSCDYDGEAGCLGQILTDFANRAWRRPVAASEIQPYLDLVASVVSDTGTTEEGLRLALQGMLMSPHFIYRVEQTVQPGSTDSQPLTSYDVATRLSYFLWSTTPDAELSSLAAADALQDDTDVLAQAQRLLSDTRAQALVDNFAGQWLQTRLMDNVNPDYNLFPAFNDELRFGMRAETEMFFEKFLREGLPVTSLLTADFTFANDALAEHYGLPLPGTDELSEVPLTGVPRLGLLTQGSFLTVTSHVNRTSPVRRGKWVLEQLLCSAPPPPPPGVDSNVDAEREMGLNLRQTLELHRSDPTCAACHQVMDAIGLGLENYDAIGAYREQDLGQPIDPSGELPGGQTFSGALELAQALVSDERFEPCVVRQLLTYGLGRQITANDAQWVDGVTAQMQAGGDSLGAAIQAIVTSPVFRMRGATGGTL